VAALFADMFGSFNLVKNHKIGYNASTTETREKNKNKYGVIKLEPKFVCLLG
jgi:hypothetical protein